MEIILCDNHFELLPQRAVFWKEQSALIVSDLHFGKATHFRKGGIAIPQDLFTADLQTLDELVKFFSPQCLIVVGDMFHSSHNHEIEQFAAWRKNQPHLKIILAKGNHDILAEGKYTELDITVSSIYKLQGFSFAHHPPAQSPSFCFSGHIHPGVRIEGSARQSLKFPCFHFTPHCCTLPAFSKFTGLALVKPATDDRIYAIVGDEVMRCLY